MMKKWIALSMTAAMVLSMGMISSAEDASFNTVAEGKLTIGTSPDFAPYEFYHIDENGTPHAPSP